MGVSGCGKSTVGQLLASQLKLPFKDADNFHPEENVKKMRSGIPLTDEDRIPWLENLNDAMKEWKLDEGVVLACSALKKTYRNRLKKGFTNDDVVFIFLDGSKKLISARLEKRKGHYMPPDLLDSQFNALEQPENAITISIEPRPTEIVDQIISKLSLVDSKNFSF